MEQKKLQVKNLQISFRTQAGILKAVRNITFDLYTGETLAIVGESGSGKSVASKAIIGILAGNSIIEGGEILYDGQDLLKIDEEHFHKIRGDKIAMIFQDPLSSLNPIMRVGKQLTEAMMLNGKARQKSARKEFGLHLKLLEQNLNAVNQDKAENKQLVETFNKFCLIATHLEKDYNEANAVAVGLKTEVEELVFLLEKNQKVALVPALRNIRSKSKKAKHYYVVREEELIPIFDEITLTIGDKKRLADSVNVIALLKKLIEVLEVGINRECPNFFRLGFYKFKNPDFDETTFDSVKELDEMTLNYLNNQFMSNFVALGQKGVQNSRDVSIAKKKVLVVKLEQLKSYFLDNNELSLKDIKKMLKPVMKEVNDATDYLRVKKHSIEYSFGISIVHEVKRYFEGLKRNPINQRKYDKQKYKWDTLVNQGKSPTWKVVPPFLVDLELTKGNIIKIISDLIDRYYHDINSKTFDAREEMIILVDFFKEQASRLVYRVTPGIAKTRALALLKEVGIPEPAVRYKQYPFEFSGGMRQRIVIAIALSANPDILICDEPTTALDVTIQSQILELINKIKNERNISVIFITHDLGVVANMADHVAVMYAGKIVEYGTVEDIFYDPRHPYTWALLSSMPDLDTKEKLDAIPGTPPNLIYPPVGDAFAERNKYAMEIDFEKEPPLFQVSETHYAATWLLHPSAPKVEPPKIIIERINRMKKEAENYGK